MLKREYLELRNTIIGAYNNKENYRTNAGLKKLTDAMTSFVKIFGNSDLKVAVNFSIKDFMLMLESCENHKDFMELFEVVNSIVDIKTCWKNVIGVYSPECIDTMKKEFEQWGDEEDWEYMTGLEKRLQPLYKDLKFQYMV